jgi:hypothetical protein
MQAERPQDWYYDNVDFMNEPFKFIAEHPNDFSEAMVAMAEYQFMTNQDSRPWGDLPMFLGEGAQLEQSLLNKSMKADDLARTIMTADVPTMRKLAADAKFAEKQQLFQNLAALPPENRGMLAINEVITSMSAANQLPALAAFPGDLDYACQKVAEANAALRMLDEKYTQLVLAVRVTAKLSAAAAQMKSERGQGRQRAPSPQGDGMSPFQQGQGRPGTRAEPGLGAAGKVRPMSPQGGGRPAQRATNAPPFTTPLQPGGRGPP